MKNLFEIESRTEIVDRINKLSHNTQRSWGKMDVAQMMAHCSAALEVANGNTKRPRSFLGYLFGKLAKKQYVYSSQYKKNPPTDPSFKITDPKDFELEKKPLIGLIDKLHTSGPTGVSKEVHPFFGEMTPIEWAQLSYNHLNHHLAQLGVQR